MSELPSQAGPNLSCCVPRCRNFLKSNPNVKLFALPDDCFLIKKFSETLGFSLDVAMQKNTRVCALHFNSLNPEVRKRNENPVQSTMQTVPAPASITMVGPTSSNVVAPFNSNFGQPIRFYLQQKPVSGNPVQNQGMTLFQPTASTSNSPTSKGPIIMSYSTGDPQGIVDWSSTSPVSEIATSQEKEMYSTSESVVPPDENSNSSVASIEEVFEPELDLQCEEEVLSPAQQLAYYMDLKNFMTANQRIRRITVPAETTTMSVQTDPVLIFDRGQTLSQSPFVTDIAEQLPVQNEGEDVCVIEKGHVPSLQKTASHKISEIIDKNTELLNTARLSTIYQPRDSVITSSSVNTFYDSALAELKKSSVSTATVPSSTSTNSYTFGDKSRLPAANPPTVQFVRKVPPEKPKETGPIINNIYSEAGLYSQAVLGSQQNSNLLNLGQNRSQAIQNTLNQIQREVNWPSRPKTTFQLVLPNNQRTGAAPTYNLTGSDSPLQLVFQKNDQQNQLQINSRFPASSLLSGISSAISTPPANDKDQEDDLLSLCNVATVYGDESPSQTSSDKNQSFTVNPQTGALEKLQNMTHSLPGNSTINDTSGQIEYPQTSGSFLNSSGPLIVDVLGASEGATEYYAGDTAPNVLFNKPPENKKVYLAFPPNQNFQISSTDPSKKTDQNLPPTIKLNSSVFSFQKSIPILPTGSQMVTGAQEFLTFLNMPPISSRKEEAEVLRTRLRTEKCISCSAWWLVRRNYLPLISVCSCKCSTFTLHRSSQFEDGFYWQCTNTKCLKVEAIRRPKFFEKFKSYTLEQLLLLTFHWACQTPISEVLEEVDMSCDKILAYYQALRTLCFHVAKKKCRLGVSADHFVEAGLVKLGSYFVLGAFDRDNQGHTRLEALHETEAYNSTLHITLLDSWLNEKAVLVTEQRVGDDVLPGIQKKQAIPGINRPDSKLPHTLNIVKYLLTNLTAIFSKVNVNSMSVDQVKGLLYELQWRAKYGKFLDMAFWSILNNIRDINEPKVSRISTKPGNLNIENYCMKMSPILRKNWSTFDEKLIENPPKKKGSHFKRTSPKKAYNHKPFSPQLAMPFQQLHPKQASLPSKKSPPKKKGNCLILPHGNSVYSLFQDVPEINGGAQLITSKSLLQIKIRCEDSTPPGVYKPNATSLGLQLRTEGFISNPVKWLVKRGYLSGTSPCYVCKQPSLLKSNSKYKDGCSWSCQNVQCKFENMFKRPLFFARFNELPMAQIAAMIFHWTVQSDYNIVVSDVPLEPVKISHAWRAFQVLCSSALKRENFKVGGQGQIVEVALVQFGRLHILGARHRITKRTLMKCFPMERTDQISFVYETLRNWIIPGSHVAVNATSIFHLGPNYAIFNADTSIVDQNSTQMHVLNVTSYLLKHIMEMFGRLKAEQVKPHLMQVYLDELMWRERFGKLPNLAFAKIMYEIFYHEKHSNSFLPHHQFTVSVKELLEEEPQLSAFRKEVCVVLHRLPETVLKYYNCWPVPKVQRNEEASSKPIEISNSDDELISNLLTEEDFQFNEDSNDSSESNNKRKLPQGSKSKSSSDSFSSSEEESEWSAESEDEARSSNTDFIQFGRTHPPNMKKMKLRDPTFKSKSPSKNPNSVQKLVIKMNKNSQKCQSYFKSDDVRAKYKKQRSRRMFNSSRRRKAQTKSRSQTKPSPNMSHVDIAIKKELLDDEPGPSGYCPDSEMATRKPSAPSSGMSICIECGKDVKIEHFMKRFSCTDCKKSIYSTCCRNAFFEHRSALLFGKRPPARREKGDKVNHGLHRPQTLSYTVACPCGFKTRVGNQMAAHLVKCQQTSCVSQR